MIEPIEKKTAGVPNILGGAHVVCHADFLDGDFLGIGHLYRHGACDGFGRRTMMDVDGGVFYSVEQGLLVHDPSLFVRNLFPTRAALGIVRPHDFFFWHAKDCFDSLSHRLARLPMAPLDLIEGPPANSDDRRFFLQNLVWNVFHVHGWHV